MDLAYLETTRQFIRDSLVQLEENARNIGVRRIELKAELDDVQAAIRVWDRKIEDDEFGRP